MVGWASINSWKTLSPGSKAPSISQVKANPPTACARSSRSGRRVLNLLEKLAGDVEVLFFMLVAEPGEHVVDQLIDDLNQLSLQFVVFPLGSLHLNERIIPSSSGKHLIGVSGWVLPVWSWGCQTGGKGPVDGVGEVTLAGSSRKPFFSTVRASQSGFSYL